MKIAIFTDSYLANTDGVAVVTDTLAKEMAKKGHKITVVCPLESSTIIKKEGITIIGVKSHPIKLYREMMICFKTPEYLDKLHDFSKYDLIHLQSNASIPSLGFMTALRFNIPLSCTFHTNLPDFVQTFFTKEIIGSQKNPIYKIFSSNKLLLNGFKSFAGKTTWAMTKNFHNSVPITTVPSFHSRHDLRMHGVKNPIRVIYNPIKKIPSKKDYSRKYKLKNKFVILHVGRLSIEKRVHKLLEITKRIKKDIPNLEVIICSIGPIKKILEKKAKKLRIDDIVRFTGFIPRDELSWLYENSSIVTSFGLSETFNICATEALFFSKPLIITDSGPHKELITNNGYLISIDEKEVDNFREKILKVYNDKKLYKKLCRNSKRMGKKYAYEPIIDEYDEFFKKAAKNKVSKKGFLNFIRYVSNLTTAMNLLIFTLSLNHKDFEHYYEKIKSFLNAMKKNLAKIKEKFFK